MAIPKEGDLTPKMMEELFLGVIEAKLATNRLFEMIPFDGIPGGDLTYKKKDDDNDDAG